MASEAAFRNFDFASDDRWNRYRARIEIPPDKDEQAILQKYKVKWYQKEVDPAYKPAAADTAAAAPSSSSKPFHDDSSNQNQDVPTAPASSSGRSTDTQSNARFSAAQAANTARGFTDRAASFFRRSFKPTPQSTQTVLFCMHLTLILLAVLHVQPLNRKLSRVAWIYFLQTSILSHGYKVYLKAGFPTIQRSGFLTHLQAWLQRAGGTTDFQYFMLSTIFLPQQSISLVVVPIAVLAVYHAFAYCTKNFPNNPLWRRYGVRAHSFLASHQRDALVYNAGAEIGTGFLLIVMIATPRRAILLTFLYWNWLRMRYFSPDAAAYHAQVWRLIDQKVSPYVRQIGPVQTAINYAQRWFLSVGRG